jgi:hypothetical protein
MAVGQKSATPSAELKCFKRSKLNAELRFANPTFFFEYRHDPLVASFGLGWLEGQYPRRSGAETGGHFHFARVSHMRGRLRILVLG